MEQAVGVPSVAQIFKEYSEAFFRDNEVKSLPYYLGCIYFDGDFFKKNVLSANIILFIFFPSSFFFFLSVGQCVCIC